MDTLSFSGTSFLSELTIAADCDALYPLGELLALLNSAGMLMQPGFTADFSLNPIDGNWMISEARHLVLDGFVPEKAAGQFAGITGEPLRAVLSGYAYEARRLLDPQRPGFTANLLAELLPKPVPGLLPILPAQFDLSRVWQACGASLHLPEDKPKLVLAGPADLPTPPTDEELLLASVVVFVAELEPTAWLLHLARCFPASEMAQLLGALAAGKLYTSEWGGFLAQAAAFIGPKYRLRKRIARYGPWSLLHNLFGVVYGQPGQLQALTATHSAFRFLRQALDELPAPDTIRRGPILLAVRDGLEWLAHTAESQGQPKHSLNFAQLALLAAQLLPVATPAYPAYTEMWLRHIVAQDERYAWFRQATSQAPEPAMVWRFAGYAGSEALAMCIFCKASGHWMAQRETSNQLWTAAWRGLTLLRTALRHCYELSQQEMRQGPPPENGQAFMLKNLLGNYTETLQTLLAMHTRSTDVQTLSMWMSTKEKLSLKPLFAGYPAYYVALRDALAEHGYGPETVRCLGELVDIIQV
jgi:hypothetical protein